MRSTIWFLVLVLATATACRAPSEPVDNANVADPVCPSFIPASEGLPTTGEWRTHPAIADIDGDGINDLAAMARKEKGPRAFLSNGLGGWEDISEGLDYPNGFSCGVGTRLGDLDGDGLVDLLVADHCNGVFVYRGNGGTDWTEDSRGIPRNAEGFNDADFGDYDGDGNPDIVAISAFTRGFMVLQGRRNGSYRPVHDSGLPVAGSGWQVELADMNGDGRLDVIASFNPVSTDRRNPPAPPAKVWLQGDDGRFRPTEGFKVEGRYFGLALVPRTDRVVPDLLLAVFGYHAGLYLYESETGEHWTERGRIDADWFDEQRPGFVGVRTDDVDGDGCFDVIANEGASATALLAMGDCQGNWTLCPESTLPRSDARSAGWGLSTGDLNGDGRPDVVAGMGTSAGSLRVWFQVDAASAAAWRAQGQGPLASRTALAGETEKP